MSTWIKLHRDINEWEWKTKPLTMALWIHLLANANYKPRRFQGHEIPVGSLVAGLHSLAEKTGLTVSQVRTALKHLEKEEIAINTTNKFTIISIVKWHDYQTNDNQITNKSQANHKQIATSKEGKKERKKEDSKHSFEKEFEETFWPLAVKKVSKDAALKAYEKARARAPSEEILSAWKAMNARWGEVKGTDDWQFVPHPATWLNQGRWQDETEPEKPAYDPNRKTLMDFGGDYDAYKKHLAEQGMEVLQ